MNAWAATHGWFLLFLSFSMGSLGLSLITGRKWPSVLGVVILANQLVYQGAVDLFDAPLSLFLPMLGDCIVAMIFYGVYERRPSVWSVVLFLLQFTICFADWLVASALALPLEDPSRVLHGYYLSANVLWTLLVACNSGPGVRHVAVHLWNYLLRARAASSVARLFLRR